MFEGTGSLFTNMNSPTIAQTQHSAATIPSVYEESISNPSSKISAACQDASSCFQDRNVSAFESESSSIEGNFNSKLSESISNQKISHQAESFKGAGVTTNQENFENIERSGELKTRISSQVPRKIERSGFDSPNVPAKRGMSQDAPKPRQLHVKKTRLEEKKIHNQIPRGSNVQNLSQRQILLSPSTTASIEELPNVEEMYNHNETFDQVQEQVNHIMKVVEAIQHGKFHLALSTNVKQKCKMHHRRSMGP